MKKTLFRAGLSMVIVLSLVFSMFSTALGAPKEATLNDAMKTGKELLRTWLCYSENPFKLLKDNVSGDGKSVTFKCGSGSGAKNREFLYFSSSAKGFHNQMLHFKIKYNGKLTGDANFISFVFRTSYSGFFWNQPGYAFNLKGDKVEVAKFPTTEGKNLGPNGNGAYYKPFTGFSKSNKVYDVKVGCIDEKGGVRLVMYVDGKKVINYLDTGKYGSTITNEGSFIISPIFDGTCTIMKV
jgi:hypothetical protein